MCTKFGFCAEVEYRPIAIGSQRIAPFSITTFQIELWTLLLMTCFGRRLNMWSLAYLIYMVILLSHEFFYLGPT